MQNKKVQVSIVIVNYRVEDEIIACIYSILKSNPKASIEIIVVDNDEKSKLKAKLKEKFKKVIYIKSQRNLGYSKGNNLGVKHSKGNFLFFLNPDTIVLPQAVDKLVEFLKKEKEAGIISPLLLDANDMPYQQGSRELGILQGLVALSFLNKLFPNNPISKKYFLCDWDKKNTKEVDVIPGTAFMIRRDLFNEIEGFDDQFFLYFEEFDLCKRIRKLGYKIFILPSARVRHVWGASTKKSDLNLNNIFRKSRFYYFNKHYGLIPAIFVDLFLRINKIFILLSLVTIVAVFLRIYNIEDLMPFIGDQGWFYLSARDTIIKGNIPLVGIPSSHPWLHQGPLWTYMLAGVFWLFGFNPLNGAYLTIAIGIFTVLAMFAVGSEMFSKRIGLVSGMLYATSPLAIIHSRTPYHTSPIPLFTLLYIFSLYKFIKGNSNFFPLSILFLSILYNLELATVILWFILLIIIIYGIWKKAEWVKKIFSGRILTYSFLAFLIPMIPVLIHDLSNNFSQTFKFAAWIGYKILKFFGFPSIHGEPDVIGLDTMIAFSSQFYKSLIFPASSIVALIIFVFSFSVLFVNLFNLISKRRCHVGFIMLFLWTTISSIGYFINKTPSEAYLPIFFPALIYLIVFSFDKIMNVKVFFIPVFLLIMFISIVNSYILVSSDYFTNKLNFSKRLSAAEKIVKKANGRDYNIVGKGDGSQFESFTMNYEYLTWRLGHPPAKSYKKLKITIEESEKGITIVKNE